MAAKFSYIGGMCVLVERSDGFKILFDPYLSKNKDTNRKPSEFYDVDLILVTMQVITMETLSILWSIATQNWLHQVM